MSHKVYNAGAIFHQGEYNLFFRAVGNDWVSRIGHATSSNGEDFVVKDKPVFEPEGAIESRGLEDPRITKIDDKFIMTFSAYDGSSVRLHTAQSIDLKTWTRMGDALPKFDFVKSGGTFVQFLPDKKIYENANPFGGKKSSCWSKSGGVFPKIINGKYYLLFNEYQIWLASSIDGINWELLSKTPFLKKRKGDFFDNTFVEMGPPPIETQKGWLVLYHGINANHVYSLGALLLDKNAPNKIIARSKKSIFWPEAPYEMQGFVDVAPGLSHTELAKLSNVGLEKAQLAAVKKGIMPKVVFCTGAVNQDDILRIYYGASDTTICTATAKLSDVLSALF